MLTRTAKESVTILPSLFEERMTINRNYLMELENQGLLQNFYLEAGVVMPELQILCEPEKAKLHWGWEAPICQLRGHFLGHWLSAASKYTGFHPDKELEAKLSVIIDELAHCQELNGGKWLGPFPEKYFTILEQNRNIWSPQYVMHKTIMGLLDAYQYTANTKSLHILSNLADWYLHWTEHVLQVNPKAIYQGEQGGMLEAWVTLYAITKDEKYHTLALRYSQPAIFEDLLAGRDCLSNCHANASIPYIHGAAGLYELTGEEKWMNIVKAFWKYAVTERGMYCTSGQNAGEFWIPPYRQGTFLGDRNQEFCTVYNMVRVADFLFCHTKEKQYGDYIERCLYNGFLAQQNPKTGMPTYFLPLSAGSRKKWGTKTRDFWCCHGTMVQAQTLYPELIYYTDTEDESIYINQFIPSQYQFQSDNQSYVLKQTSGMKYYNDQALFDESDSGFMSRWLMNYQIDGPVNSVHVLYIRIPWWNQQTPTIIKNGKPITDFKEENGYLLLSCIANVDMLQVAFHSEVYFEYLKDLPEMAAVLDGPVVLAGLTQEDRGIQDVLSAQLEHTYDTYPWKQNGYRTRYQSPNFLLKPLYEIEEEAYTVYFTVSSGK